MAGWRTSGRGKATTCTGSAEKAGTSGIILVTSSTHQDRADGNFVDAGANLLATVSYPDGSPQVNAAQFARDVISPLVNQG